MPEESGIAEVVVEPIKETKEVVAEQPTVAEVFQKFNKGVLNLLSDPDEKTLYATSAAQKVARIPNLEEKLPPPSEEELTVDEQIDRQLQAISDGDEDLRFGQGLISLSRLSREIRKIQTVEPNVQPQTDSLPKIVADMMPDLDEDGKFLLGFTALLSAGHTSEKYPSRLDETSKVVLGTQTKEDYKFVLEALVSSRTKKPLTLES